MIKRILPTLERLLSLLVVFLMLSATTLWTGRFFGKQWGTDDKFTQVEKIASVAPNAAQMTDLGLAGRILVPRDSASWFVWSADRAEQLGVVLSSEPYASDVIGYAGTTPLYIYLDNDDKVKEVVAGENFETRSFFRRAADGLLNQWDGLPAHQAAPLEVDAVTGATYSSHALIENMRNTLAVYAETEHVGRTAPIIGWVRTFALFAVFGLGIFVSFRFKGKKWWRIAVLVLNVGVTGFWCGQFLSISVLRGWIENGADFLLYLPTLVMLLISLIMPYLGKPNHYCMWMCPYGSLQELAWRLPFPKIKVKAKTFKRLRSIRFVLLSVLMLLLWMGYGAFLLDYEPFSAFIVTTAAPAVIVLAASFVVLGLFFPHPWCHCVCPVGALLNLAEEKK